VATLAMDVREDGGLRPGYELKLNSYDLGVDIELYDAIQRLRFEHPEVGAVIVTSGKERIFCAGANIRMLGQASHGFKVNFCKFTNETRNAIEEATAESRQTYLTMINGPCAGGGYELALATDYIVMADDGNTSVSLPEVPLLAVLPGTGGLTRLVDKRKVRRDRADVFCTVAEGIKGKRAKDWNLVDAVVPRSKWEATVAERAKALAAEVANVPHGPAVELTSIAPYRHVELTLDPTGRIADLTISAPDAPPPAELHAEGAELWSLRAFRELDDALLRLRFDHPTVGVVRLRTRGAAAQVLAHDEALAKAPSGFAREVRLLQRRVLKRLDNTARSLFAVADAPDSCFAGVLLEVALAADRFYMLIDGGEQITVRTSGANAGFMKTGSGLSRLESRFYGTPDQVARVLARGAEGPIASEEAEELGLATVAADDIDFEDELRIAVEERASLSPDALTGMEASLRWVGPETLETKIFGRLSAWQNWIFTRPNATGEHGALTLYGRPERPAFHWTRT
jgi:benzoyl-CoA-dihydrodiol lyase